MYRERWRDRVECREGDRERRMRQGGRESVEFGTERRREAVECREMWKGEGREEVKRNFWQLLRRKDGWKEGREEGP